MEKKILGLRTAVYHVPKLDEAKEWYTKAFGKEPYFDEPFYVGFDIGGYELGLLPEDEKTKTKSTSVQAYWGVEDIEAEFKRILDAGAKEYSAIDNVGEGLYVATLLDPWGNPIGLIQNPHFKLP